jgi:hypothetical protein
LEYCKKEGMSEHWNIEVSKIFPTIVPLFHHSNIPILKGGGYGGIRKGGRIFD